MLAQPGETRLDALLGFIGKADSVTRHELEEAQRQLRLRLQLQWRAEVGALAMHAEFGVGDSRTPVAQLRKKRAGLRLARFQRADRGPMERARVSVIFAHPSGGVFVALLGN